MTHIDCYECNTCKKKMENECGGVEFEVSDGLCSDCGGWRYHFCSLKCLKEWVDKKESSK